MKNTYIIKLLIVVSSCIAVFCSIMYFNSPYVKSLSKKEVLPLQSVSYPITSILPKDTDFNDLKFLIHILRDKRVILLGEKTHTDGSTFLAKSRLIKFLHQKLDYDVLLFESGLYDMHLMQQIVEKEHKMMPEMGMWNFWANAEQTANLWDYIKCQLHTSSPITLGGFDVQFSTGNIQDSTYKILTKNYLSQKNMTLSNYPIFEKLLNDLTNSLLPWKNYKVAKNEEDTFYSELENIILNIEKSQHNTREDLIYIRFLKGMKNWYCCLWNHPDNISKRLQIRDSLMADNLIWLIDCVYQDKKIMVWTSNLHVIYDNHKITTTCQSNNFISMGTYLKKHLPNESYVVCFSSYGELNNNNQFVKRGSNKSFEYQLHQKGVRYSFIDFKAVDASSFLNDEFYLLANQNINLQGKWSQMIDGLFYIDTMQKNTYKK